MTTTAVGAESLPTGSRHGRPMFLLSIACLACWFGACQAVRIGVLLKPSHRDAWREFEWAMSNFNTSQNARRLGIEFNTYSATVDHDDDLFTVTHELCRQLSAGVTTILLPTSGLSDAAVRSLFSSTNVPRIITTVPENCAAENSNAPTNDSTDDASSNGTMPTATDETSMRIAPVEQDSAGQPPWLGVSMIPDLSAAVLDLARAWNFRSAVFFYDSDHALVTLERLLQPPGGRARLAVTRALRISRGSEAHALLSSMERVDPHGRKLVVLDCDHELAKDIVIRHVRDIYMGRRNYHFVLARPVVSHRYLEGVSEFAAINITAFRFQNTEELTQTYNYKTTAEEAAIVDAAQLLIKAYRTLREEPPARNGDLFVDRVRTAPGATSECGRIAYLTREQGRVVDAYLKGVVFDGKTGRVEFDEKGCRVNFTVDVIQVNGKNQWLKTGTWSSRGFMPVGQEHKSTSKEDEGYVYRIAATLTEPFLMRKIRGVDLDPENPKYEGFSKDLMEAISRITGIKYAIHVSKGGARTAEDTDSWEALVSELLNGEADVAVGDMAATAERWHDVDLTRPVLTTGLAAIVRSTTLKGVGMRTFLAPFVWSLWMGVLASLLAVYIVLFLVGFFSVKTTHCCYDPPTAPDASSADADKPPPTSYPGPNASCANFKTRSISGRILSSFWWMFVVLVFSTYTTQLASYLIPRYEIGSWEELDSTQFKHMWVPTAATRRYFESTQDEMILKLYRYMEEQGGREVTSLREGVELVRSSSSGDVIVFADALSAEYLCGQPPCNARVLRAPHATRHVALAVQKNGTLRERFNQAIATLSDTGELEEIKRRWWSVRCDVPAKDEPIQIRLFFPVVVALGILTVEGTGFGLAELLVRGCTKLCLWARLKSERSSQETEPPLKTIA